MTTTKIVSERGISLFIHCKRKYNSTTRVEALNSNDSRKWKHAMNEEIKSLRDNNTWTLVDLPTNKNVVDCK